VVMATTEIARIFFFIFPSTLLPPARHERANDGGDVPSHRRKSVFVEDLSGLLR